MAEQALRQAAEALSIYEGSTRAGASFFAGRRTIQNGTSRTPSPTARSAVIARSTPRALASRRAATRQSVLPLPPSAREVAARSADGGRAVIRFFSPPVGCADSPLPEGALQRGSAALTGRRTPRAFVPLRSTAGRRPLRSGLPHPSVGRAKFFAKAETFPGRWVYDI